MPWALRDATSLGDPHARHLLARMEETEKATFATRHTPCNPMKAIHCKLSSRNVCECVYVVGTLPRCMDMITADEVIRRIDLYFQGGAVK